MENFGNYIREISYPNLETGRYTPKSGVSRIIRESWQHCFGDSFLMEKEKALKAFKVTTNQFPY